MARVRVDCSDLNRMVRFWSAALGYEVARRGEDTVELRHPTGSGPKLYLRQVGRLRSGRSRVQLDLSAVDAERVAGWLSSLGARRLSRYDEDGESGFVFSDPEGNEFRVVTVGTAGFVRPFA
jgi:catechol 2,3-dioxygenase-like lactoylglutathione lyase family enzyme